ncbi:MAG TPA: phosphatase PAP2 family protein [Treponemataceae bacterium]|jgi:membrane-associated phospholipid phosphatase|nr:phosphatase PAP2 family protein [Treponemataceae bacterium]
MIGISEASGIYAWGLEVIRAFQGIGSPALTAAMRAITLIGEPIAYFAIIPFVYWCVDERRGLLVALTVFASNGINGAIKSALRVPRPFVLDPSVGIIGETGFSTPSAHAQNSAALWPTLLLWANPASRARSSAARSAAVALPFLIGISRVYLGVHYPTDVLAGWAIGALFSVTALVVIPAFAGRARPILETLEDAARKSGRSTRGVKIGAAALVALVLNAVARDASMGGMFFGFASGAVLLRERTESPFRAASGTVAHKAIRLAIGLAGAAAVFVALKKLLPGASSPWGEAGRFVRYAATGAWASFVAPLLFTKIGLARNYR